MNIPHSGVSRGHRNVPIQSDNHYMSTPDSSGLRGLPNRTPLRSDVSSEMSHLSFGYTKFRRSCASPDYTDFQSNFPQTLFGMDFTFSTRSTSYASKYQSNINSGYKLTSMNNTCYRLYNPNTSKHVLKTGCLVSPLEAATGKGGNHSWQPTRQPRLPRTVYKLFRV